MAKEFGDRATFPPLSATCSSVRQHLLLSFGAFIFAIGNIMTDLKRLYNLAMKRLALIR